MLKAEDMVKYRFFCLKSDLKKVVQELYKAKAIDIIEHEKTDELDLGEPLAGSAELSDAVVKARAVMFKFGMSSVNSNRKMIEESEGDLRPRIRHVLDLHKEVFDIVAEIKAVLNEIKAKTADLSVLRAASSLGIPLDNFQTTKHMRYVLGYSEDLKIKDSPGVEFYKGKYDEKEVVAIFYDVEKEPYVMDVLRDAKFSELKMPVYCVGRKNVRSCVEKELETLRSREEKLSKQLKKIKAKERSLPETEKVLSIAAKKAEAPLLFGETKNISMITGWIPKKNSEKLEEKLKSVTKKKIGIEKLKIEKDDSPPIKLNNPVWAKPYEFLLRLFSMPSYNEIDPVIFMFFTFPLFFGFMLGDIGYGLVTLLLFLFLRSKMPSMKDLMNIFILCSISSIFFGAVFAEGFGFELGELFHHGQETEHTGAHGADIHTAVTEEDHGFLSWITSWPLHRNPASVMNLIYVSLLVGFLHVNFGLILGFINVKKAHGLKLAIFEKGGWFLVEFAVALGLLYMAGADILNMDKITFMGVIPLQLFIAVILLITAIIFLVKGEGFQAVIELPSILIHIASYMRLMAIGLASVGLAGVINEQAVPLFHAGLVGIIAGIAVFTIGHIVNIALGIIGPFLHSLRLHYVEHFTKFYSGGGKEFRAFGADDN